MINQNQAQGLMVVCPTTSAESAASAVDQWFSSSNGHYTLFKFKRLAMAHNVPTGMSRMTISFSHAHIYSATSSHSCIFRIPHSLSYCFLVVTPLSNISLILLSLAYLSASGLHCSKMNAPEEQLTSEDIVLLRSLLGRFGGQLTQTTPSTQAPPLAGPPIQPSFSATQPSEPFTQSMLPVRIPNNSSQLSQQPSALQPAESSIYPVSIRNDGILQPRHSGFPPHPGHPSVAPAITPYHSALAGAQGHPPRSTRISSTVENIGSGIASQVNQQRLAAAAVNLPSHVSLPQRTTRRRRRGPAILPPTLTPTFSINSVLTSEGSSSSPLFRIKVKVYPPQVIISLCIFLILHVN